jgi:hypothetical protein
VALVSTLVFNACFQRLFSTLVFNACFQFVSTCLREERELNAERASVLNADLVAMTTKLKAVKVEIETSHNETQVAVRVCTGQGVAWCLLAFTGVYWCLLVFVGVYWCFMMLHHC